MTHIPHHRLYEDLLQRRTERKKDSEERKEIPFGITGPVSDESVLSFDRIR